MPSNILVKNHLFYIDGIRAIAAIYVVIHHGVLQYYDGTHGPINNMAGFHLSFMQMIIVQLFYHGHYFVDLFIVISCFSLMLSVTKNGYIKGGSLQFFKRRIIRILPPYYFAVAFSLVLIWLFIGSKTNTIWDASVPVNLTDVLRHVFLIHDFFIHHIKNQSSFLVNRS